MRSFVKINHSRNRENTLSFTDVGELCPSRNIYVASMSFSAIRENENLHFSKLTVTKRFPCCRLLITFANSLDQIGTDNA